MKQNKKKIIKSSRSKKLFIQFAEYMITGGVWFWSGYVIIVALDGPFGLFVANFIGNSVGITLNFLLERYWVFRTKNPVKLGVIAGRYIIYTVLNAFALNYFILLGLREQAGVEPEIGQFIASGFFTVWNYFWYKYWVFKKEPHKQTRSTRHHA